ncbi:MAG: hypothetical protein ACYDAE_27050 [Steroidobacteraceae bacterium]
MALVLGPIDAEVPLPGDVARDQVAAHYRFQLQLANVMLEQRQLRVRRVAVRRQAFDVLLIFRKELLECALGPRVDGVANGWNVASGVAAVLLIFVRYRVLDVPEFGDAVGLLVLIIEAFLDEAVELQCRLVRLGVRLVRPILFRLGLGIGCCRLGLMCFFSFFLPRAIRSSRP